jgi:hypothetical protein
VARVAEYFERSNEILVCHKRWGVLNEYKILKYDSVLWRERCTSHAV